MVHEGLIKRFGCLSKFQTPSSLVSICPVAICCPARYAHKCLIAFLQVEALRAGLNEILPVQCLAAFRPSELRLMFCGEDRVEWDEKTLLKHLRPSGGLTGGSQLLAHLVAVLLEMDQPNRARFLDFASSCPRLPPGGIANFHLDVFPEPQKGSRRGLPRSRACANQLYLPPYSSKEELQESLFEAMCCSAGHHEQWPT